MEKIIAQWNITLKVECPYCEEYFDLMDQKSELLVDYDVCESETDYEVECPECGKEFKCDFEY